MPVSRFSRLELRTTAIEEARSFYESLLPGVPLAIVALPAAAAARGAPPNWLGYIGLDSPGEVVRATAQLDSRGATRLGPPQAADPLLRDPGGAVFALTAGSGSPPGLAWLQLHTAEAERTAATYAEVFGWSLTGHADLGPIGRFRNFAYASGEPDAGSIGDTAGRPELHPHWMFYFEVRELDRALDIVAGHRGLVAGSHVMSDGTAFAACEDPHRAAFGLIARGR